tara:strand:+ start:1175 stop:1795 length:621 start_codon:yes stop_codon:yes gene_type:complete
LITNNNQYSQEQKMILRLAIIAAVLLGTISQVHAQYDEVKKKGGRVLPLSQADDRVEISYHLSSDEITDANLQPLVGLEKVYAINLRGTKVTNAGLASISKLESLTRLHLEKTEIGDEGLTHLSGLKNLEYLNLYATKVTDAGLSSLEGLTKLKKLYLWESGVTKAGVEKLQAALPELEIIAGFEEPKPAAEEPKPEEKPAEEKKE